MAFTRTEDHVEIGRDVNTVVSASQEDRWQAVDSSQLNKRIQRLYSIALVDTSTGDVLIDGTLDPASYAGTDITVSPSANAGRRGKSVEFFFRVPPKVVEMTEPFSTTIVPTQNGGKFVESHGSILKQIRVQGTTGLRPNKVLPPAIDLLKNLGVNLSGFTELSIGDTLSRRRVPDGEATGWDDIIFLRNIFRLYSDIKEGRQTTASARNVVMVWRNAKDLDFWIVEPQEFKLSAAANSPFTYQYSMSFKTLASYDYALAAVPDPLQAILSARRFLSRIQDFTQALTLAFSVLSQQINRLAAFGIFGTDLILKPMLSLVRGLLAVKTSLTSFGPRVQNHAQQLLDNIADTIKQLAAVDVEGTRRDPGELGFGSGRTLRPAAQGIDPVRFPLQDPLRNTLIRVQFVLARILAEKPLHDTVATNTNTRRAAVVSRYSRGGGPRGQVRTPITGGSSTFLGNEPLASTVVETTVHVGESLRDIAQRCLGDRGRWHILAVMNNLSAPYISATGGVGVLAPGDRILCPARGGEGVSASEIGTNTDSDRDTGNTDENLYGEVQQAYGRDLRLLSAQRGTDIDLTDLVVGQDGDLSSVSGIPNVSQAMNLKFAVERGELAVHPGYGSAFPLGSKATSSAFTTFQIDVRNTLRSDPRISAIESLEFVISGTALLVETKLRLVSSTDVLTTSFALRRF